MFLKCPNRFVTGCTAAIAASIPVVLNAGSSLANEMPLSERLGSTSLHDSANLKQSSASVEKLDADIPSGSLPTALFGAIGENADTTEAEPSALPPTLTQTASCAVAACLALGTTDVASEPALPADATVMPFPEAAPALAQAASDADASQADLAKASQNPIASLISVPFQNNTNFGVGEFDRTSNILNVQPVIPVPLSDSLTLVNRTIVPIAYQPELAPGLDSAFGLGDINYTGFFVPNTSGNFTWGVGPSIVLPTATDTVLGTAKWSIGPAAVGLVSQGPIVTGALVSQLWSFAGDNDRSDVSLLTIQPFFNYNFAGGWYATTSPIITANWEADDDQWTLPIGGGAGRVFNIGSQPVNASVQAYWNVIKPEGAADWTLRAQLTLLFP